VNDAGGDGPGRTGLTRTGGGGQSPVGANYFRDGWPLDGDSGCNGEVLLWGGELTDSKYKPGPPGAGGIF